MERINCISINHRTAPVDIRERIRVDHTDLKDVVAGGVEAFALNTCNRTEVYWTVLDSEPVYRLLERVSPYEEDRIRGASNSSPGETPSAISSWWHPALTRWSSASPRSWAR